MAGAAVLIGREMESAILRGAIGHVLRGESRCLVLTAEAGLGKTSLLELLMAEAADAGVRVLHAKADELEQDRPFGVIRRCLQDGEGPIEPIDALLAQASAGRSDGGWIEEPELRFRVIDSIIETLDEIAAHAPVALVIDDYQWIDEPSSVGVASILRRLADRPVLTVIAARVTTARSPAQVLLGRFPEAAEHRLGPLDDDSVAQLVAETTGGKFDEETLHRAGRAGGNPFLIKELVASTADLPFDDDDPVPLPETLQRQLLAEFDELGSDTKELLRVAAVIGTSFTAAQLAELGGLSLTEAAGLVADVLTTRILVPAGRRLDFGHDLWREAIYSDTAPPVRAALHLAVGRLLTSQGAPASEIATHVIRGAEVGDLGAVEVLRSAAAELGWMAPATASRLLENASRLLPDHHPDRLSVLVELAQAYVFSVELERSIRLVEEHLTGSLPQELELGLRNARSQCYFLRGGAGLATAEFEAMVPIVVGQPREAVVLADAAISAMFAVDLDRAADFAHRSIAVADHHRDKVAPALARSVLAWLDSFSGDLESGLKHATEAVAAADAAPGLEGHRRLPILFYAQILLWTDRVDEARVSLDRGRRLSAELEMGWDEPMYQALLADERLRSGEWDDALAEAEAGVQRAEEVESYFALGWLYAHQARVHLWRDDLNRASEMLDLGDESEGGQASDQIWHLRALAAMRSGDSDTATFIWTTLWEKLDQLGMGLRQLEIGVDVFRHAQATSDEALASRVVERLGVIAAQHDTALARSMDTWCRALLTRDPDLARSSVELMEQRCHPVDLARCQGDAASILHDAGETALAARLADAARRQFDVLGASALADVHLAHMLPDLPTRPPAKAGWEALTNSERRVVEFVGEGLSNAEIAVRLSISRRTVESHLYHSYPKLGLSNRVELALFASKQGGGKYLPRPDGVA